MISSLHGAHSSRLGGSILISGSLLQWIAAFLPMKVFTTTDPFEKLFAIQSNITGWILQALIFPISFLIICVGFFVVSRLLITPRARIMVYVATGLSFMAMVLWLPISIDRIQTGLNIVTLIENKESIPGPKSFNWIFWSYTICTLLSIAAFASALAVEKIRKNVNIVIAIVCLICLALVIPLWGDWPPLFSYFFTLVIGINLALHKRD